MALVNQYHFARFEQTTLFSQKNSKSSIWLERDDFYGKTDTIGPKHHVGPKANQIIGGYVPRTHDPVNHISISHCAKHVRIEDANKR
jgi:hypothetical protein